MSIDTQNEKHLQHERSQ